MKKITLAGIFLVMATFFLGCAKNNQSSGTGPSPQDINQNSSETYAINNGDLVFFWGQGCPHCENVDKFLKDNNSLEEKIKLKKIEVFNDTKGQKIFLEKIKECNLNTPGVPVLYKDGKCTSGDVPIIEELKKMQ